MTKCIDPDQARQRQFDILLVGGGHAQLAVLADWIEFGAPTTSCALVSSHRHLRYSGTLPGWISGQSARDEGLVDLEALCDACGIKFVEATVIALDPAGRNATCDKGVSLSFSIASIDTGGVGRAKEVLGHHHTLVDIRPISAFVDFWDHVRKARDAQPQHLAVAGGGAGGVELALAIRNAQGFSQAPQVTLIAGADGLLPTQAPTVRYLVNRELRRQGIAVLPVDAACDGGGVYAGEQRLDEVDLLIAALGSAAPRWPADSGLAVDVDGFIAVDSYQRSTSHPHIFASGDVARRLDCNVAHAGVHAVHTGPVLAKNIRAAAAGRQPRHSYSPRPASLYLLSTGQERAIMSYGPIALSGRWVWRWKQRIDKRWLARYAELGGQM